MFTYIAIAAVLLIVALPALIAMQSSDFRVDRKILIPAPPSAIFDHVSDLHKWTAWSPWERVDPNMKRTYSGPAAGNGASYAWVGNKNVGAGQMTITECRPNELVRIKLEFFKPFKATNTAEFTFQPQGDNATQVTWSMYGPKNFMAKAMHLVISMDKMCGGEFEKGLTNLKSVVTKSPAAATA